MSSGHPSGHSSRQNVKVTLLSCGNFLNIKFSNVYRSKVAKWIVYNNLFDIVVVCKVHTYVIVFVAGCTLNGVCSYMEITTHCDIFHGTHNSIISHS